MIFKPFHNQPRPIRNFQRPPGAEVNPVAASLYLTEGEGFLEEGLWQPERGAQGVSGQRLVPTAMEARPCLHNGAEPPGQPPATVQARLLAFSATCQLLTFDTVAYCFWEGRGGLGSPLTSVCPFQGASSSPFPSSAQGLLYATVCGENPDRCDPSLCFPLCSVEKRVSLTEDLATSEATLGGVSRSGLCAHLCQLQSFGRVFVGFFFGRRVAFRSFGLASERLELSALRGPAGPPDQLCRRFRATLGHRCQPQRGNRQNLLLESNYVLVKASLSTWTLRKKKAFLGIVVTMCVSKHVAVSTTAGQRLCLSSLGTGEFSAHS